jgi:hypothetical protein
MPKGKEEDSNIRPMPQFRWQDVCGRGCFATLSNIRDGL